MGKRKVPDGCGVGTVAWGYTQMLSAGTIFSPKELKGKTVECAIVPLDGRFKIVPVKKPTRRKPHA